MKPVTLTKMTLPWQPKARAQLPSVAESERRPGGALVVDVEPLNPAVG